MDKKSILLYVFGAFWVGVGAMMIEINKVSIRPLGPGFDILVYSLMALTSISIIVGVWCEVTAARRLRSSSD